MEIGFWELVAKHLSGNTSAEEEQVVHAWIKEHPANQGMVHRLRRLWNLSGTERPIATFSTDEEWTRFQTRIVDGEATLIPSRFSYPVLWRTAASLLLIISLGFLIVYFTGGVLTPDRDTAVQLVSIQASEQVQELDLPDGSRVWLNAGSTLSYLNGFSGEFRKVFLHGEAFFDVTRDTLKPFQVFASKTRTEVLGTSFFVRTGPEEQEVQVTVLTGKVSFGPENGTEKVILTPEETGTFQLSSANLKKEKNQNSELLAWMPDEGDHEEIHPMSYLESSSSWKKNAIGLTIVDGRLKNVSDHTHFYDIDLLATLHIAKKNKQLSKRFTIKGPLKPGETYDYRKLVLKDWFSQTSHVSVKVIHAETDHNKPKQR